MGFTTAMKTPTDLTWDEVQVALRPLLRTDNRTNLGYLALEYAWLAMVLWGCSTAFHAWWDGRIGGARFVPLAALGVALVAVSQHRLSGLAHDASHYTLFRNRLANELIADLFLMFPLVAMTQRYRTAHLGHHQFVNDPDRDPDLLRLNAREPHRFPISRPRFWLRYVIRNLWPLAILGYLFGRAKAANLGTANDGPALRNVYPASVAKRMRGSYWLAALTAVHALDAWAIFGLFWVVPLLTAYPLLMQLREIAHHSNAPDDGDLTNSRVFRVNPVCRACIFPYGQALHLTHHLFAVVPHYRIARAHRLLLDHRPYREQVVTCRGYFFRQWGTAGPSVLELLSRESQAQGSDLGQTARRKVA
jgi:fatty acid desaturase